MHQVTPGISCFRKNKKMEVKSVDGPNRRVIVTLLEVSAVEEANVSQASHVTRPLVV